jgi:MYXO-CTERM domain-containing protein
MSRSGGAASGTAVVQQEECVQFRTSVRLAATAALLIVSPAVMAQNETDNMTADTQYTSTEREDDGDFPWGLLGLLGLAGLLGARKRERDIHVDARRNP